MTILEPRDFAWIAFGALRASASSDAAWGKRMTVPLNRVLKTGSVVRGRATGVDSATRTVSYVAIDAAGGEGAPATLSYDYLVLATGASFSGPFTPVGYSATGARAALRSLQATVRGANNVVIVGGGPCGIELAGEVRDALPNATISIIHSGAALLTGAGNVMDSPKLSDKLLTRLAACNVAVTLNERVTGAAGGKPHAAYGPPVLTGPLVVSTSKGRTIADVDLLVYATGAKPNTQWLENSSLSACLEPSGHVRTARTYAVVGAERVFALGDCAGGPDAKGA